jgi:hypothetical protein
MYFDDDDLAAIHTLACAAREIYEKHCEAQGVERKFEQINSRPAFRERVTAPKIRLGPMRSSPLCSEATLVRAVPRS